MQQDQINIVGAQFFQESFDNDVGIRAFLIGNAARLEPDFADDGIIVARNPFDGRDDVRMSAVKISQVEHAHPAIERAF